jgi:hypothetical protein
MRRSWAVLLLVVGVFLSAGWGQARKKKPARHGPPADLPGHVDYLAYQLWGKSLDESGPLTGEIQKLVVARLEQSVPQAAAGSTDNARLRVEVRQELEKIFAKVRYPIYERTAVFVEPWKDSTLIGAGYTLGWSDTARANAVALFERRAGRTRLATVLNFRPGCELGYAFLPSPPSGDFWFLVYGTRLGKSHPRLSAELYSFDGQKLHALWKTEDVYDGKLDVEPGRVVINYMRESAFVQAATYGRRPPRREAVYKIAPQGLELVTDQQVPKS